MRLLFATSNKKKIAELSAMLAGTSIEIVSLADAQPLEVVEDGDTFEANALKKARAYSAVHGITALADDSGLCVDALYGGPGVRSARFAPEGPDQDARNTALLLARLSGVPMDARGAEFRCVLALVSPDGIEQLYEGRCRGRIVLAPRGANGFGYDPIFEPAGLTRTLAELSPEEKNALSHRGKALAELVQALGG